MKPFWRSSPKTGVSSALVGCVLIPRWVRRCRGAWRCGSTALPAEGTAATHSKHYPLVLFSTVALLLCADRAPAQSCELVPIALSGQSLSNTAPGAVLSDVLNGNQPGGFGWLTWGGSPSEPALVKSLTPPGDSFNYVNPNQSSDHQLSVGDWVRSKPGVSNSRNVRDALEALKDVDVTVPVWDQSTGHGANALYRIAGFARVRLIGCQLPQQNRITARFLGYVTCDVANQPPTVNAGADQTLLRPANETVANSELPGRHR